MELGGNEKKEGLPPMEKKDAGLACSECTSFMDMMRSTKVGFVMITLMMELLGPSLDLVGCLPLAGNEV
jgi:hypothetical protein